MTNRENRGKERMNKLASAINFKNIGKGVRITYGVVWNLLLLLLIVIMIGGAFAGGVGAGYFAALVKDEKVRAEASMVKDIHQYEETSTLYFANNVPLGKLRSDIDREEVSIKNVSEYLKKAVVATEDEYFYEHKGVVPKALFRAVFQEFTNSSVQSGGSTLTQQLIKNQILTNEVSFDRKAKEVLLALRIERFLDKDQILEAYLNVSTFGRNSSGQNIGGVQAAAKGIFGIEAKDLNLPQAAFIAGLPQSPFGYTPFTNKGELKSPEGLEPGLNRMKTVLSRMKKENYITDKEYKDALKYDITKDFIPRQPRTFEEYPALTFELEERAVNVLTEVLANKDGYSKDELKKDNKLFGKYWTLANRDIRQNGYNIHSTINKDIYDIQQKVKDEYQNYGPTYKMEVKNEETGEMETVDDPVQIGSILIENKTGKILSFVGGRDYNLNPYNHATQAKRQNGSTMKPLLVYAPAYELGASAPGAIVADLPYNIPAGGKTWTPHNFTRNKFYGLVSTRYALAKSYNASAVATYMKIIDQKPLKFLEKMGFTSLDPRDYAAPALALGGLTVGVTVEENTNAYTTFANGGKFIDGYMIEKITDQKGNIIYEHKSEPVDVFSPQTAYLMTDVMRDVLKYGTAAGLPPMLKFKADWAGKTGTSNESKDSWLVVSNPNVTMGTWMGYKSNKPQSQGYDFRNYRIWANLMNAAYDAAPDIVKPKDNKRFEMPGGIVNRSYCAVSGMLPSEACSKAGLIQADIFNAKYVPSKTDDSLGAGGRYVLAGDKKYAALPSTPEEFTKQGLVINPEFLKRITMGYVKDFSQLIPKDNSKWKDLLVADDKLNDDGKAPAGVNASYSDGTIKWGASSSKDVIGYRIYSEEGKKIASIMTDAELSHKVGDGMFYVVAVDIAGRESKPSEKIGNGDELKKKEEEEKKKLEEEQKKAEEQKKKEEEQKKKEEEKKKQEEEKKKAEEQKKKEEEQKKKDEENKKNNGGNNTGEENS
ncbi:transglycosylase domain-containing protein [Lederbergia wuyishanensis]|uniref:Penicillin-binding protein n=1 Tax=Lederbergia wuyishanensis TaxID=1347903 RepID=A0ABU0D555_9BACI|nr:transglycosylase domain-containing protein [Lederbergia wuyishanensis]MCJ8009590.1 penicillin-binding protein [Lederbergia wuyishanensis]MDQ0343496.1 penicillin-binding protein [Lederbergia wuyishanensis]